MQERILIICVGFILDFLFGDPYWLWHPVRFIGKFITWTERFLRKGFRIREEKELDKQKKRFAGVLLVIIVISGTMFVQWGLLFLTGKIHKYCQIALECFWCYQFLAMKSLKTESMKVYQALEKDDIEAARYAVSMIVGRDTKELDKKGITKAAVETVAENTSDGVIAPLLFMLCFGVQGGLFYKTVNTMDSMVGYRNDAYQYLGTAAARLDDILNYIPARVSAIFMLIAAFFQGLDFQNGIKIFLRDRYNHKSPNSAQTEAVCAGVLNVELAGNAWYFGKLCEKPTIGDHNREIESKDIYRINRLMYGTSFLTLLLGLVILMVIGTIISQL
ncbi:MAG: cobalamin biosynthesis protein CobD [Lachnospiraceae bacterium]|nr:cobalamin biosynthesis protein CobD [Lachnospiraceae bacterium]